jgi:hypothetical protein
MEIDVFNSVCYTTMMINNVCSLKCKFCITGTPYQAQPRNYPLNEIKADIDKYFEIFHDIRLEHFDFIGGEPFLHPDLPELSQWFMDTHGAVAGELRIVTNGSQKISELLLDVCVKNNVMFMISNYGKDLSPYAEANRINLEDRGIKCIVLKYDGKDQYNIDWIDFGDYSYKYYSLKQLEELRISCAEIISDIEHPMKHHLHIKDGKVFVCERAMAMPEAISCLESDCIDLRSNIPSSVTRIQLPLFKKKLIECCKYCNGFIIESGKGKRVPIAIQLN